MQKRVGDIQRSPSQEDLAALVAIQRSQYTPEDPWLVDLDNRDASHRQPLGASWHARHSEPEPHTMQDYFEPTGLDLRLDASSGTLEELVCDLTQREDLREQNKRLFA